jgi:hypothetical protein
MQSHMLVCAAVDMQVGKALTGTAGTGDPCIKARKVTGITTAEEGSIKGTSRTHSVTSCRHLPLESSSSSRMEAV